MAPFSQGSTPYFANKYYPQNGVGKSVRFGTLPVGTGKELLPRSSQQAPNRLHIGFSDKKVTQNVHFGLKSGECRTCHRRVRQWFWGDLD